MTKNDIIECWFRDNIVQDIVKEVTDGAHDAKYDDLVQMIYLSLLEKDEELIQNLHYNGQYKYYISKMVMLQIASKNSRLYYQLRRFSAASSPYDANHPYEDEEALELRESWQQLQRYIDALDNIDREYMDALFTFGTQKEVAKEMGITEGAANKRFQRIYKRLRWMRDAEEAEIKGLPLPKRTKRRYRRKMSNEEIKEVYRARGIKSAEKRWGKK